MSNETSRQTEGLCKEVTICIRDAYERGYKQGFKDGTNSEYEHDHAVVKAYNDGQAYILDKIRAEIEQEYKVESEHPYGQGLRRTLQIIYKYKAESEDKV